MIVHLPSWLMPPGAGAFTAWPFVFLRDGYSYDQERLLLLHEEVHLEQQRRWALYGLGVGLVVWFFLYLFVLPFWWNPWRERWEREAYRACGYSHEHISTKLRRAPYYLWSVE